MREPMRKSWLAAGMTALACLCACTAERARVAELKTDTESVKLGQAKSVSVELSMGAGELTIRGGASDMMNGAFTYNVPAWKPRIGYRESGDQGTLTIEQPGEKHSDSGDTRYSWDVQLNDKTPVDVHVEMGAGKSNLELGGLSLRKLHVEIGAGQSLVDLVGNWKHDVDAHIEGGVGQATIRLPRGVGVHVTVEGGLGSVSAADLRKDGDAYVNEEYGKSPVTVNVRVEGGVGKVILELGGGPTV